MCQGSRAKGFWDIVSAVDLPQALTTVDSTYNKYRKAIRHFGHENLVKVPEKYRAMEEELMSAKAFGCEGFITIGLEMADKKAQKDLLKQQWEELTAEQVSHKHVHTCLYLALQQFIGTSGPTAKRTKVTKA